MIDSESAWTVVVPLEARFQIARQAGVEVTGARDTADDVDDSFVVAHAVDRRIASGKPDYWDRATILELAILAKEETKAFSAVATALAVVREVWEPETTARNLRLIREARAKRAEDLPWALEIEQALEKRVHGV